MTAIEESNPHKDTPKSKKKKELRVTPQGAKASPRPKSKKAPSEKIQKHFLGLLLEAAEEIES